MALITCPECQQQVSDQATTCPNCGFPISNQPFNAVEENKEMDTPAVPESHKTKTIIAVFSVLCILLLGFTIFLIKKTTDENALMEARSEYIANLNDFAKTSLVGAAASEDLCALTIKVWNDTIFEEFSVETYKYAIDDNGFRDDFNDALIALYSDEITIKKVSSIKENRDSVSEIFKKLSNPTEEFETCYDVVDAMYSAYHNLTELAISPSGSLKTYSKNVEDYDKAFIEQFEKLKLLIPNESSNSSPETTMAVETDTQASEASNLQVSEPQSNTSAIIGNLKFNLSDGMYIEKRFDLNYKVTLLDHKSLLYVQLTDVADKRSSQSDLSGSEVNKTETTLSIAGFTATGETYSDINGRDISVLHIDVSFSDADYVYDLEFMCNNQDENWEEYLNLFHEVINSVEYIGDSIPETTPENTEQPTEKPTEPRGTAGNPYGPGMFLVGKDIPAGEYLFTATNEKAYVCASSDSNQDDIIENANFPYTFFMTVSDGQYLEVKRCKFSAVGDQVVEINKDGSFQAGMYRVGTDIPAGEYKLTTDGSKRGYYCIYDSTAIPFDIVNIDNFKESAYVTVSDGQYIITSRCTSSAS